jgi:membrane protein implicated in regulation of membrane protease activity
VDELVALIVAVILAAVLFGLAVLALVGSVVVGVLFLVLAVVSFLSGVIRARREDKRKARDSNPEGN